MGVADKLFQWKQRKAAENLQAGNEFLAKNAQRPEVITLNSGLQYEVLIMGTGKKPIITDTVICHYEGKLINETVFDSSVQRGKPAVFALNKVIKGWTEALQLMPVGSKWRLFIPSNLAYGNQQVGSMITPNSTLIFEVELLGIQ
ncbi:FKBP-type peptidyl-prolyl cis-trans isomerase [Hydrotalea sandarakina]|jgi:FKBP-type peptidyl-prolyl cis-trans isomerase FklB|uniref:Peptidyl-prolyl cis-trans isomerase n=1 Tax=Hydrotalea sandarakina TaxID=1004304 RepID=A0A2W7RNN8_9BACT|nr:FKBP-type peptidyl-prolyl cis-trans isomerase [Hydrotalea sandarakina]PZX61911.1 FKBP-type peptidyl-prolyl cis-trans isomerase FklB [Hydrotalea sandarakina]